MSPKEGSTEEKLKMLDHEVKGLRLQVASKQEILDRLIHEVDNLYNLLENMREREREKDIRIENLEKELIEVTASNKQERSANTGNRPSETSPSCKITQFAGRK